MSIDVMTKVIQRAPVSGSRFTCMLVMANWSNDDGDSLYPSMDLLAGAMRVSRSQAKRVLRSLMPGGADDEASGDWWFRVVGNEKGRRSWDDQALRDERRKTGRFAPSTRVRKGGSATPKQR